MSPLERDALPGAALDPAIARLRGAIHDNTDFPVVWIGKSTAESIVAIMERARDALLAQDAPADVCRAELQKIAHAKRFDQNHFIDDTDFADWVQSRALAALSVAPIEPSQDREDAALLALERITYSYRLLLAGKPVRDAAETLAEADAALSAQQEGK